MTTFIVIVALIFIVLTLWEEKSPHIWSYRNPYDRTCTKCKRHEQEECWADEYARYGMESIGTWEVYNEGDGSCQKKDS